MELCLACANMFVWLRCVFGKALSLQLEQKLEAADEEWKEEGTMQMATCL